MEPWQLAVGERYTDFKTVRFIELIDVKTDTIKYIENPRGSHFPGVCSIQDFCYWATDVYTLEKEYWEV